MKKLTVIDANIISIKCYEISITGDITHPVLTVIFTERIQYVLTALLMLNVLCECYCESEYTHVPDDHPQFRDIQSVSRESTG